MATTYQDRIDYIRLARWEGDRLFTIAEVLDEFEFDDLAHEVRLEASFFYDRAAQAQATLGVDGLLV